MADAAGKVIDFIDVVLFQKKNSKVKVKRGRTQIEKEG